ncbi:MAG: glycosyltransferase family 4 protein [Candidatus Hodarchaeota archaeon]
MTIFQMHLAEEDDECNVEIENIGEGKLIWVPSVFKKLKKGEELKKANIKYLIKKVGIKTFIGNYVKYYKHRFIDNDAFHYCTYYISNQKILEVIDKHNLDLLVFHWISPDSQEIVQKSITKNIPFVVVNHFDNGRLKIKSVRRQISQAAAFAGVSNINVPSYLSNKKFTNVSDGVDTEFFKPENTRRLKIECKEPFVFLPSRITPNKGHLDVVRAVSLLKKSEIRPMIVFAGQHESTEFLEKLRSSIKDLGMNHDVMFVGRRSLDDLRDWYAASALVVLPSYSEGLGRVLLEAQAMKKPVVAYDVGGVSEAIKVGKTGYTVRKGDVRGLSARIQELLTDDKKRIQMGECGRSFVQSEFSLLKLARRHEDFYLDVLLNAGSKRKSHESQFPTGLEIFES